MGVKISMEHVGTISIEYNGKKVFPREFHVKIDEKIITSVSDFIDEEFSLDDNLLPKGSFTSEKLRRIRDNQVGSKQLQRLKKVCKKQEKSDEKQIRTSRKVNFRYNNVLRKD